MAMYSDLNINNEADLRPDLGAYVGNYGEGKIVTNDKVPKEYLRIKGGTLKRDSAANIKLKGSRGWKPPQVSLE